MIREPLGADMLQEKLLARAAELRAHVAALAPALAGSKVLALLEDEAAELEALGDQAGAEGGEGPPNRPRGASAAAGRG